MGTIAVHEFIALDGVFEDPSWTFDYGFHDHESDCTYIRGSGQLVRGRPDSAGVTHPPSG